MQQLVGLGLGIIKRHESYCECNLAWPFTPTYVWQADPPLPAKIVIDVSIHIPNRRPAPPGWVITQRMLRSSTQMLVSTHLGWMMPSMACFGHSIQTVNTRQIEPVLQRLPRVSFGV